MGIDVNERSIDLAIVKPGCVRFVKIDISEVKHIRERYFRKRMNIQKKTSGETRVKLLTKYSGREKRRVNDILHRALRIIADIAAREKVKPAMENLKDIRKRINCGKKINRRLHSIPFRKTQFYIAYKSVEKGYKPEYVDPKNSSRACPIRGVLIKPKGHALYILDMGCFAFFLKAAEAFKAEVERMVTKQ